MVPVSINWACVLHAGTTWVWACSSAEVSDKTHNFQNCWAYVVQSISVGEVWLSFLQKALVERTHPWSQKLWEHSSRYRQALSAAVPTEVALLSQVPAYCPAWSRRMVLASRQARNKVGTSQDVKIIGPSIYLSPLSCWGLERVLEILALHLMGPGTKAAVWLRLVCLSSCKTEEISQDPGYLGPRFLLSWLS